MEIKLTDLQITFFKNVGSLPDFKVPSSKMSTADTSLFFQDKGIMSNMQFGAMLTTLSKRGLIEVSTTTLKKQDAKGRDITKDERVFNLTTEGNKVLQAAEKGQLSAPSKKAPAKKAVTKKATAKAKKPAAPKTTGEVNPNPEE